MELKSESIEYSLLKIISQIIQPGESYSIQTPSLIYTVSKFHASDFPSELDLQSGIFVLPSICDLFKTDCTKLNKKTIMMKVVCSLIDFFILLNQ